MSLKGVCDCWVQNRGWTVRGMNLRKGTSLGSNLASVTDLKRIQTLYSLCCDFGGYKTFTTRWSGGRLQVWVQVWAPACHLAISPKAVPQGYRRFRGQNPRPSSGPACAGRTGEHKHRAFPSRRQSLRAATCSLEENMLPLFWYWLSSRANKVLMLCKFRAATSLFFFHVKWNFDEIGQKLLSTKDFAQSFYQSLVSE